MAILAAAAAVLPSGFGSSLCPLSPPPPQALSSAMFLPPQLRPSPPRLRSSPAADGVALTIRMGGGPRTYPGGVSKWQWKRMQAKKAKQLLKARLCRERQIYEMRKRAELKAAISELERPWEAAPEVHAPTLFSVGADEQLKVLADRFQRPGGFDMWSPQDGPQVLRPYDGLPSARFFPKGVVHSVKPYGGAAGAAGGEEDEEDEEDEEGESPAQFDDWAARGKGGARRTGRRTRMISGGGGGGREKNGGKSDFYGRAGSGQASNGGERSGIPISDHKGGNFRNLVGGGATATARRRRPLGDEISAVNATEDEDSSDEDFSWVL